MLVLIFWAGLVARITDISDALYQLCHSLAGRSWRFDNLIALPLDNQLVKAALRLLENPATTNLAEGLPYGSAVGNHDPQAYNRIPNMNGMSQ